MHVRKYLGELHSGSEDCWFYYRAEMERERDACDDVVDLERTENGWRANMENV